MAKPNRTIRHLRKTRYKRKTNRKIKPRENSRVVRRDRFAQGLMDARRRDRRSVEGEEYKWHKDGGKDTGATPYRFKGDRHRARRFFGKEGILGTRIPDHLRAVVAGKGNARVLDIGSGEGGYWASLFRSLGPEAGKIELHTLNPSAHFNEFIPTEAGRKHVGAVETKALAKIGRFDLITAFYSIGQVPSDFYQVFSKLRGSLSKNGKLVLIFGPKLEEARVRKALGASCKVDLLRIELAKGKRTFNNILVATRTR